MAAHSFSADRFLSCTSSLRRERKSRHAGLARVARTHPHRIADTHLPAEVAERDRLAEELGPRLDRIAASIDAIRAEVTPAG